MSEDFPTKVTRLELHRAQFELNKYVGPLLNVDELNSDELLIVNNAFLQRAKDIGAENIDSLYAAYASTLHWWGIMCPHPQAYRLYNGCLPSHSPIAFEDSSWFGCSICGTLVINRQK